MHIRLYPNLGEEFNPNESNRSLLERLAKPVTMASVAGGAASFLMATKTSLWNVAYKGQEVAANSDFTEGALLGTMICLTVGVVAHTFKPKDNQEPRRMMVDAPLEDAFQQVINDSAAEPPMAAKKTKFNPNKDFVHRNKNSYSV